MDVFGLMIFWVYGAVCALFGAGYYHFVGGVEKTKRELATAKEKLAALETRNVATQSMIPLKGVE